MTIKDFVVGQTAYVYNHYDKRDNPAVGYREEVVAKVGRAYVTLRNSWGDKYGAGYGADNYLVEKVDAGSPRYLFRTKQDVEDFIESNLLRLEIRQSMDWGNLGKLSVAQLRAIKKILEGGEDDAKEVH